MNNKEKNCQQKKQEIVPKKIRLYIIEYMFGINDLMINATLDKCGIINS